MQAGYRVGDVVRWHLGDGVILEIIGEDRLRVKQAYEEHVITIDQCEFSPFWKFRLDRIESERYNKEDVAWLCRMLRMKTDDSSKMQTRIDELLNELSDYRMSDPEFIYNEAE